MSTASSPLTTTMTGSLSPARGRDGRAARRSGSSSPTGVRTAARFHLCDALLVRAGVEDGFMARYIQRRWDEEDVVFVFELDDAGWVTSHLEFRGRTGGRRDPAAPGEVRRGRGGAAGCGRADAVAGRGPGGVGAVVAARPVAAGRPLKTAIW